jgi:hypothetical protein
MRQLPLHPKFIQLVMADSLWVTYTGFLLKWNLWREIKIYAFTPIHLLEKSACKHRKNDLWNVDSPAVRR